MSGFSLPLIRVNMKDGSPPPPIESKEFLAIYNSIKQEYKPLAIPFITVQSPEYFIYTSGFQYSGFFQRLKENRRNPRTVNSSPEHIAGLLEKAVLGRDLIIEGAAVPVTAIIDFTDPENSFAGAYELLRPRYGLDALHLQF